MALAPVESGFGGFMVRGQAKDHGTGRQIEGHLGPGDRALVFDDVVTAGGSIVRAIEAVRAAGAEVVGTWCLVDRGQGGREKLAEIGAPLRPVFEVAEVLNEELPEVEAPPPPWSPRTPVLAADAILELEPGHVLLIRRRNPPPGWALPGGFVEVGESVETAVRREIEEETGLVLDAMAQMHTYSAPGRDPRFPTVSVIFVARAKGSPRAGDDAAEARLFPLKALPADLCFDHRQILEDFQTRRHGLGLGWSFGG
jgi:8-oxo-dGTP diphosphatase